MTRDSIFNLTPEQTPSVSSPHPPVSQLLAFHQGELPPPEYALVESHRTTCSQCDRVISNIATFLNEIPSGTGSSQLLHSWETFRTSLQQPLSEGLETPPDPYRVGDFHLSGKRPPRGFVSRRSYKRLLVAFVFTALALAGWGAVQWWNTRQAAQTQHAFEDRLARVWEEMQALELENQGLKKSKEDEIASLNEKLSTLVGPRPNWPVFDVFSAAFLRRTGSRRNRIELPPETGGFSLILIPEDRTSFPTHRVEIVAMDGRIVWQDDALRRNRLGGFNLTMNRESVPQDRFTVRIYGKTGTRLTPIGEFPVILVQAGDERSQSAPGT